VHAPLSNTSSLPISPGFGSLDTSTLKHTAPLSQNGQLDDLADPLAGVGSPADNSGNPFDEDFGAPAPVQTPFPSQAGNHNHNSNRGADIFGDSNAFDQPQTKQTTVQQNVSPFGNSTPTINQNGQSAFMSNPGINMRTAPQQMNQQMTQQLNQTNPQQGAFMQTGFPFDANTFGGQVQVPTQVPNQMYAGVMPGQMAQFGAQTGMMQMPYTYVMTQGFAPGNQFTAQGQQQQAFAPQTSAQVTVTNTAPAQPKKSNDNMFSQLDPLAPRR
jgi:hypothetical protein